MSDGTGIQWATATWNPVVGCTRVSSGCDHCYAVTMTNRLEKMGATTGSQKYAGLTVLNGRGERHFNGTVRTVPEDLAKPLHWRRPRRVFVNSMSDLFHREVPFEFIDRVFAVMALCPRHTFIVLTKRPERAAEYFASRASGRQIFQAAADMNDRLGVVDVSQFTERVRADGTGTEAAAVMPLPNLWLLASCEDQKTLEERVPHLLACPAAVRGLSLEPLLGPVDLSRWIPVDDPDARDGCLIDWVITGCESDGRNVGRGAEAYPRLALSIIAQCQAAGVSVFNKQMPGSDGLVSGEPGEWSEAWRVREFPGGGRGKSTECAEPHSVARVGGFTLIELLVVIVVIGVLLGIFMPSLVGSRVASRELKCASNLRQVGATMRAYMDEQRAFPDRLIGSDAPMELPAALLACPMNRAAPAGWTPAQFGSLAGWSWASITSYESLPMTVANLAWNPVVYVNRWEQSRPDKQVPLCNDTRQAPGVAGWHFTSGGTGKVTRYNAVWAAGDVTWWDGVVP